MQKHNEKNIIILKHLRNDSRKSLAFISRETGIPVSTIFDKLAVLEREVIKKYTTLLDFSKMGYNLRVIFMVKGSENSRDKLKDFFIAHPNINTFLRINNGYDFYAEMVFREMSQLERFKEELQKIGIKNLESHYLIEEVKREDFLSGDDEELNKEFKHSN